MEKTAYRWRNWFGNLKHTVDLYQPSTLDELRLAVKKAAAKGKVRAVGNSYAWSPLVPVDGSLVSLEKLRGVEVLERGATYSASGAPSLRRGPTPRIRVECGWPIERLVAYTGGHDLTLITPTIFQELALGGALAVGAHGTGLEWSTMSDAVAAMRIVNADGELIELDESDGDLFDAARVALGTFGVVYDVELRCEPAFNVHVEDRFKPRDEVLAGMDDLLATYEFVELYWFPFNDTMWIKVMRRIDEPAPPETWKQRLGEKIDYYAALWSVKYVLPWLSRRVPQLTPQFMHLAPKLATLPGTYIESATKEFHYQQAYPRCWDMSYAVPIEDTVRAWRASMALVDDFAARGKYPINMVFHSRFIGASRAPLAVSADRATCDIEVTTAKYTPHTHEFFEAYTDAIMAIPGARPHWGKYILQPKRVRERYPRMDEFLAVRKQMDPRGVFLNRFVADELFQL